MRADNRPTSFMRSSALIFWRPVGLESSHGKILKATEPPVKTRCHPWVPVLLERMMQKNPAPEE